MINKYILLVSIFLVSISAHCQVGGLRVGIKDLPGLNDVTQTNSKALFTYAGGIQAIYQASAKFSLESGLYLLHKGYRSTYYAPSSSPNDPFLNTAAPQNLKFHFFYLSLPLMVRYNLTDHFYLSAGPTASLFLKTTLKGEEGFIENNFLNKENYNSMILGGILAGGYQFKITKNGDFKGFIEAIYNPSFSNYFKGVDSNLVSYGIGVGVNYHISL